MSVSNGKIDIGALLSQLEGIREFVDEAIEQVIELQGHVESGLIAVNASSAREVHKWDRHDPLPIGRIRHSPADQRWTADERRAFTEHLLATLYPNWLAPLHWATQHYDNPELVRCMKSRVQRECAAMVQEGTVKLRSSAKRGVQYEYILATAPPASEAPR